MAAGLRWRRHTVTRPAKFFVERFGELLDHLNATNDRQPRDVVGVSPTHCRLDRRKLRQLSVGHHRREHFC